MTTVALSKWRSTVSAALAFVPSPSQIGAQVDRHVLSPRARRDSALLASRYCFWWRAYLQPVHASASLLPVSGGQVEVLARRLRQELALVLERWATSGSTNADPEAILDHVERDLTATHGALDEAHHGELGLFEHEAIARAHRQLARTSRTDWRAVSRVVAKAARAPRSRASRNSSR